MTSRAKEGKRAGGQEQTRTRDLGGVRLVMEGAGQNVGASVRVCVPASVPRDQSDREGHLMRGGSKH